MEYRKYIFFSPILAIISPLIIFLMIYYKKYYYKKYPKIFIIILLIFGFYSFIIILILLAGILFAISQIFSKKIKYKKDDPRPLKN